ncbi:MAG: DUF4215 domain-containing protein [Myxococcota bacterium]
MSTRIPAHCLLVLLVAAGCGGDPPAIHLGPPGSVETHAVVTVQRGAAPGDVWRIRSVVTLGDRHTESLLPEDAPTKPMEFPITYSVLSRSGEGDLVVEVEALGQNGEPMGRGKGTVKLLARKGVNMEIQLRRSCQDNAECTNNQYCDGEERCEDRACVDGTPPCGATVECVDVECKEDIDRCVTTPVSSRCDEGSYCDPARGCRLGIGCDDDGDCAGEGSFCNPQLCVDGRCQEVPGPDPDDDNVCTVDFCDPQDHIVNVPVPEGNACTQTGVPRSVCRFVDAAQEQMTCQASACGDGFVDLGGGEACDDGNTENADGCSNACQPPRCGDGITQPSRLEECDDGDFDDTDGCTTLCRLSACGDGQVQAGVEECDDGNDLDADDCTNRCTIARCGDASPHLVTADPAAFPVLEECDDGNDIEQDNCTTACELARCGDGIRHTQLLEECDDGNASNTDDCTSVCRAATCGDGYVHGVNEECDDGNGLDGDDCTNACEVARCGDGATHVLTADPVAFPTLEECDDGNQSDEDNCLTACLVARCGDGFTWEGVEACDDGNTINTDSCVGCQLGRCGDGITRTDGAEDCDDGNVVDSDDCTNACSRYECGDGITHASGTPPFEACDDGNPEGGDACTNACTVARCGDGVTQLGVEDCDDGNNSNNDDCLNNCQLARCGDGVVQTTGANVEECDDANVDERDTCRTDCTRPVWQTEVVLGTGGACPYAANGDGGPAIGASVSTPSGVALGSNGNVYFSAYDVAAQQWRVRRVVNGVISTLATPGVECPSLAVQGSALVAACGNRVFSYDVSSGALLATLAGNGTVGAPTSGLALQSALYPLLQMALAPNGAVYVLMDSFDVDPALSPVWAVTAGTIAPVDALANRTSPITGIAVTSDGELQVLAEEAGTGAVYSVVGASLLAGPTVDLQGMPATQLVADAADELLTTVGAGIHNLTTGSYVQGSPTAVGAFLGHECPSVRYSDVDIFSATITLAPGTTRPVVADKVNGTVVSKAASGCWSRAAGVFPQGIAPVRDGRCVTLQGLQELALDSNTLVVADDTGFLSLDIPSRSTTMRFPVEDGSPALACPGGISDVYTYQKGEGLPGTRDGIRGLVAAGNQLYYQSVSHGRTFRVTGADAYSNVSLDVYTYTDQQCCNAPGGHWRPDFCEPCPSEPAHPVPRVRDPAFQVIVASDAVDCRIFIFDPFTTCFNGDPTVNLSVLAPNCGNTVAQIGEPASVVAPARAPGAFQYALLLSDTGNHRVLYAVIDALSQEIVDGGDMAGSAAVPGYSGDEVEARGSLLSRPTGVGQDSVGSTFIADTGNARVRQVTADGFIRTVAQIPGLRTLVVHSTLGVFAATDTAVYRVTPVP